MYPRAKDKAAASCAAALRVPLRRRARRPGLQTRCARTAGPDIPGEHTAAAAAAKSATALPLARSPQVSELPGEKSVVVIRRMHRVLA